MNAHWTSAYVGKPHDDRPGAEGPEAYSCWGLGRAVFRDRKGIEVPFLSGIQADVVATAKEEAEARGWARVADAVYREEDVLLFKAPRLHVGIVVRADNKTFLLHAKHGVGVCLEPLRDVALGRKVEVWRVV